MVIFILLTFTGNFGRVYLAVLVRNRDPEKRVAVKTLQGEEGII